MGDRVEARFKGGPEYYGGRVTAVDRAAGHYAVHYDDGDSEEGLSALRVRQQGAKQKKDLLPGAVVEARFGGGQRLFGAVVTEAHGNGTFDLKYDDGDAEKRVPRNFIMAEWH